MAEPNHYLDVLYPLQDHVLAVIAQAETAFYLTGGTAASRGYLHHRFSDDLDLFVNDDRRFTLWADRVVERLVADARWRVEVLLREERFVRVNIRSTEADLKIELVNDVPSRAGAVRVDPVLGRLDSPENILANELTAIADRQEPKDLADVWGFCCRLGLSIEQALGDAHGKAAGLFAPDLARVLLGCSATDCELIRWQVPPDVGGYLADLRRLGERLLLVAS